MRNFVEYNVYSFDVMNKELDWGNLSFGYIPTDYNVRCYFRDGKWGEYHII